MARWSRIPCSLTDHGTITACTARAVLLRMQLSARERVHNGCCIRNALCIIRRALPGCVGPPSAILCAPKLACVLRVLTPS